MVKEEERCCYLCHKMSNLSANKVWALKAWKTTSTTRCSKCKLENITCDCVVGLPNTKKNHDAIWVVIYRLTKFAHFITVQMMMSMDMLVKLYMENIWVCMVPITIVSDQDAKVTSRVWKEFQEATGTSIDWRSRTIQKLEDLFRASVLNWQCEWEGRLPLAEFFWNKHYQSIIGMTTFEALYGAPYYSAECWLDTSDWILVGHKLIEKTVKQVELNNKRMKEAQDWHKSYANFG